MRLDTLGVAAGVLLLVGCGSGTSARTDPARADSGISGTVHLGPQCPVETVGEACADRPAAGVTVTVSEQVPGEAHVAGAVVARVATDTAGRFEVRVAPGDYVVTAEAGMSCGLMDARVSPGLYPTVEVACDTGIR